MSPNREKDGQKSGPSSIKIRRQQNLCVTAPDVADDTNATNPRVRTFCIDTLLTRNLIAIRIGFAAKGRPIRRYLRA
jgi:response regulator of citrate/malate metabolism